MPPESDATETRDGTADSNPFAGVGEEYDAWYTEPLGAFVEEVERALLLDGLRPRPQETIADVGAGTGRLAAYLAQHQAARVVAVEPSASMRAAGEGRTRGLAVEWRDGVAEELPQGDASVDAVALVTVLEFVPDPARAVAEARRVLRPGGRLVVGGLSPLSGWGALYRHLGDGGAEPWASARFWTPEDLANLLGVPEASVRGALSLAPSAEPPYPEADAAGSRAGNAPAFLVARWERPPW